MKEPERPFAHKEMPETTLREGGGDGTRARLKHEEREEERDSTAPGSELSSSAEVLEFSDRGDLAEMSPESPLSTSAGRAIDLPSPASRKRSAPDLLDEEGEAIKQLPRIGWGIFAAMIAGTILFGISSGFADLFGSHIFLQLPIQIYWAVCLQRISLAMSKRFRIERPLSALEVGLLSGASLIFIPKTSYGLFYIYADPFFWLWAIAQLYWPWKLGYSLFSRRPNQSKRNSLILATALALGMNAYWMLLPEFTYVLKSSALLGLFWLTSNFLCIYYFAGRLRKGAKLKAGSGERQVVAGTDIVIRYRVFAAIERWIKQRFMSNSEESSTKTVLTWAVLPVVIILSVIALGSILPSLKLAAASGAGPATGGLTLFYISSFITFIAGTFTLLTYLVNKQPTHVGIGVHGLRLLWRHRLYMHDGTYLPWGEIASISMKRPPGKTSPADDRLVFESSSGESLSLKMGSLDSVEDKETLLKAIQKNAPEATRDSNVTQALQPPADYSYTELWLQALSAPPKRERLQPLIAGALMRNDTYQVVESLGVGGQGQAYLATDRRTGESVVLKEFILPVYVDVNVRRSALEQFENEARILRHLDNRQIVKLIDFFVEDHRTYLVLEHIEGASLRELVKARGKLQETQVRELAAQMCDILHYLHGLTPPVVHRDFTPDNLILRTDGTLKLIDFNVARQVVQATTSGTVVGKHAYLPPEQFRGMPEPRSDIYAMGATLHYLLTGADPEPIAVSHPQRACPEVSDSLNAIVEKATAIHLEKRYANTDEVLSDLNR